MPKLVAGFITGVVATLLTIAWLGDETPSTAAVSVPAATVPGPVENSESAAGSSAGAQTEERAGTAGSVRAQFPTEDAQRPASTTQSPPLQQSPPTAPESPARTAPDESSPTTQEPSEYPPEIADMIENNVDKDLQARYEADQREESWATYMEGQLAAYFAQKSELAQFYLSLIDCRTSVCSVHALGYGPDALTRWNSATADLVSQPWFEFNSMSMNRRNPQPDVLAIVLIITKRPPN